MHKWCDHEIENQWGEEVHLKGAAANSDGMCVVVGGDKLRCGPLIRGWR